MRAGVLRQRVTFKTAVETADGKDGFVEVPATVRSRLPAHVRVLEGRELERARAIDPRAKHLVTVRYFDGYLTELAGGRVTAIWHDGETDRALEVVEPPREVSNRETLEMACRESA